MTVELVVFVVAGLVCVGGAIGVVVSSNPVHAALSLVATLFGIAVLFVAQEVHFLAAVQVIVYAGAIVVLFLFVIMLLGVDRSEDLSEEPIVGQRVIAALVGLAILALPVIAVLSTTDDEGNVIATGQRSALGSPAENESFNVAEIGEVLLTDHVFALQVTSFLLVIAVVGAVLLSKRISGEPVAIDADELMFDPSDDDIDEGVVDEDAVDAETEETSA